MRFISADISNYRLIKHLHIDFDKELTLVGGPNESGKSTVAEALHRVLFLKPRGQGALITAMKSEVHEGAPQVSLRFEVNGTEYLLSKKFGANGSIELSYGTSHNLQGEDAERRLSELLNTPMPTRNSEVMAKWSHLWIWQGESTTNPIGQIGEVSSKLEERLLEMASGISVRSDRDRILQEHFHMEADANYTQARNAIRAGSPLQLAKGRFEQLKESYDSALDKWQDLEALASRLPELEAEANRISIVLDTLHSEGKAVGERHETLTALNADRTAQETRSRQIVERLNLLREKDDEVRNLLASNDRLTNEIQPDELVLTEHEIEIKAKEHELGQAILYRDEMDRMLADFQQSIDLLRHLSDKIRCESGLNATEEAIRVLEGRETELDTVIGRLCKLPDMDQKKLTQLRSLHGRLLNAEAALNAIATEIQIEGFTGKAILEGEPMDDGQPYTITETSYIDLGGEARMRITPGGGTSLEEARKTERGLTREWHDAIQASGVESLEDAERKLYEINELKSTRKRLEAEISAGDLPGQRNKKNLLVSEMEDLAKKVGSMSGLPLYMEAIGLNGDMLKAKMTDLEDRRKVAYSDLQTWNANVKSLNDTLSELRKSKNQLEESLRERRETIVANRHKIHFLEKEYGDSVNREKLLRSLAVEEFEANAILSDITAQIIDLDPSGLDQDRERIGRAVKAAMGQQTAVTEEIVATRTRLDIGGGTDPFAAMLKSQADLGSARLEYESLERKARAFKLLSSLYEKGQSERNEAFIKPLSDRIANYLDIMFGKGGNLQINYEDGSFEGLTVGRSGYAGKAQVSFDNLSGGTKEQLAAAVRLAMAEVLAPSFSGCIPMVLDDAFVNTDPERVGSVVKMLFKAAKSGVQVILMTCTPADYASLGAESVRLEGSNF